MASEERPLRLLSLDGGGVRGLSTIYIVQDIMRRVNLGRSEDERLEPWQYFDMIGGTSTGGIIAIMLGCLKMSLEECEKAYIDLSKEIFTPRRSSSNWMGRSVDFVNANGKFDAKVLEDAIKKIIGSHSTSSEVELLSDPEPECKVFVCAIQSSKRDITPALLRTYRNNAVADLYSKKFKLWEACRATSAASTFFEPLILQDGFGLLHFLDGGIMLNNPVNRVFQEAQEVWGRDRRMSLISVGTGDTPSGSFHGNLKKVIDGLTAITTDTRGTAEQFYSSHLGHPQLHGNYFRLNVSGMGTIGLEEHDQLVEIGQATSFYLETGETKTKLEKCVEVLLETERQGSYTDEPHRLSSSDIEKIKKFTRNLSQRSCKYGDINRVPQQSRNTCQWFLGHPNFIEWQQSKEASALWVTAEAGCGKSVLARFLIDHLSDGHKVIHFFFQHSRYNMNDLLCALLHQLLMLVIESSGAKSSAMLQMLRNELEYKKGEEVMKENEKLWDIICNATTGAEPTSSKLFCVIDGLDECQEQSRPEFIKFIVSAFSNSGLARQPHHPPNFIITSRPYPEIEDRFRPLSHIRFRLENETSAISNDIETMIADKIQSLDPECFPEKMQKYLHAEITRNAGRTFLWVKLIFDALEQMGSTTREEVRKILETSPSELDSFYETSLSATKDKEKTRKLLQILIVASRPLHLMEVNVALQIRATSKCFEDIDLEPNIRRAIKQFCGSVLHITDSTVDFMYQTAREFLIAPRFTLGPSQNLTWGASIDLSQAHCILGSICLRYLALTDWNEKSIRWIGETFDIGHCSNEPHEWARRHGGSHNIIGNDNQSEDNHPVDSSPYTREELDNIQAEINKISCLYQYAGENWPYHSEEVLQQLPRAGQPWSAIDQDFSELQALLASLRESGTSRIRRYSSTSDDPFDFLKYAGFQSVVDWLSSGPCIEHYTDGRIIGILVAQLSPGTVSEDSSFEHLQRKILFDDRYIIRYASKAISQYRFDEKDQDVEQTEIFEFFLRHLPLRSRQGYLLIYFQAIRWRHPSVDYFIRYPGNSTSMRIPSSDGVVRDDLHHALLQEMFCMACRYGSPTASLLLECSNTATDATFDVNRADLFGVTPLIAAILANDYSLCEWLLRRKANVNVCVSCQVDFTQETWLKGLGLTDETLLLYASAPPQSRHWNWTEYHPNIPNVWQRYGERGFNSSPLAEALRVQNLRIFGLLLEYEGDPWQDYGNVSSVFEAAASHSGNFFDQAVDLIRTKRADAFHINSPETHSRRTLLHIAAKYGLWNSIIKLISKGSSISIKDAKGWTPLHEIASLPPTARRTEILKRLMEDHGSNVNIRNGDGLLPLDLLENSFDRFDRSTLECDQGEDHMETGLFLTKLGSDPSYLPSVRRTTTMRLNASLRNETVHPVDSSSAAEVDWDKEIELGSDFGSDSSTESMSNNHRKSHKSLDMDDVMYSVSESGSSIYLDALLDIDSKSDESPDAGDVVDLNSESDGDIFQNAMSDIPNKSDES